MTKRLHLLRHAKSSWDDPRLDDHERPLAPRGRSAGLRVAAWVTERGPHPELVLCSTAVRAQQTLELLLTPLGDPPVAFEAALYHATTDILLQRVHVLEPELDDVLLVGHNPGLQDLVLLVSAPSPERDVVAAKLPTGALVTIELDTGWSAVAAGGGRITAIVRPRLLPRDHSSL
jgi:phosphohistidine phosphatase